MKVLVTGGSGFIGSHVVRRLLSKGRSVRCLVRSSSQTSRIDSLPVERVTGDILDRGSLTQAMEGCDGCIHLASVVAWEAMRLPILEQTIVEGTRNVLEVAAQLGVRRIVYVSSSSAVNGSAVPNVFTEESPFELSERPLRYAIAKHSAEQICHRFVNQLDIVTVNPAETYGPGDTALVTARNLVDFLQSWPVVGCYGGTAIVHVEDVADGIVAAFQSGRSGERYILGGDNLTIETLIRLTLSIAGQRKPVIILPTRLLKGLVGGLERLRLPTPLLPEVVEYATLYWFVDSSKAVRELAYSPRPARAVLEPTVEWLRETGLVR